MLRPTPYLIPILIILGCLAVQPTHAGSYLYGAAPYNVFLRNDFSLTGSDVIGAVAAGGTVKVGSISIGSGAPSSLTYSVVAGTDFIATSGGTLRGNLWDGKAGGISSSFTVTGKVTNGNGASSPLDFTGIFMQLNTLSDSLAAMASTRGDSCTNSYGTITCNATAAGLNIINIPAGNSAGGTGKTVTSYDLGVGHNYGIVINVADSATAVVVNVGGKSDSLGGAGWKIQGDSHKVIFNYSDATSLSLGSSAYAASVLAPDAAVTGSGGDFDGNLIAKSFTGFTEFHTTSLFFADLPLPSDDTNTPEPATWILMPAGAGALWWFKRRR
jgi:choice-of-anchor A domain-containing protein